MKNGIKLMLLQPQRHSLNPHKLIKYCTIQIFYSTYCVNISQLRTDDTQRLHSKTFQRAACIYCAHILQLPSDPVVVLAIAGSMRTLRSY